MFVEGRYVNTSIDRWKRKRVGLEEISVCIAGITVKVDTSHKQLIHNHSRGNLFTYTYIYTVT